MRVRVAFLTSLLFLAVTLAAQTGDARLREFEQFAEREMKAQRMPGLSVAVSYGDASWARGFGFSDVENQVPATAESSYRMASVTKPMTAVAILDLVEQGKIDLDAEVQTYVPYFPRKSSPITICQLLAHQGGISHYRDYDKEGHIREPKTTREAIAIFADWDLVAEPGTRYSYTSYGYNVLGAVIEEVSKKPYGTFMTETVWRPLGMAATVMDDPRAIIPHRVQGYVLDDGTLRRSEYVDISSRFAAGGTRSTVGDMIRFVEGVAAGKVLDRERVERAWTGTPTREGRRMTYGLGFGTYSRNGRWVVAHGGSQQETRTSFLYFPASHFTIALASNFENARLDRFEDKLIELYLGDPQSVDGRADAETDATIWDIVETTFSRGFMYYDRYGKEMASDPAALKAAFRYFHEAVAPDKKKMAEGAHPMSGEMFVKVGSHMAAVLAAGGADPDLYHREGPLRFFADYARVAKQYKLDRTLAARVAKWNSEWMRAWTPELRAISFGAEDALDVVERHRDMLAAATIRPDFAGELLSYAEEHGRVGEMDPAIRAATLGVAIYPRSPGLNGVLGVLYAIRGDREQATRYLQASRAIDPKGYASPENLRRLAGHIPEGMRALLLELAGT